MSNILNKIKSLLNSNSDIFRPIAVLTAICLVVAILLSFTNLITKDTIANMELKASNDAMSVLISAEKYEKADVEGELYIAKNGEEVKGYIVKTVGRGYGGDVVIMTAISSDKNEINAVTGATVSSKAVTGAVNKAFECLNGYLKTTQVVTETTGEVQ